MSVFLNNFEKKYLLDAIEAKSGVPFLFFEALQKRVYQRVAWGNLLGPEATTIWWHSAAEYISDAAMSYALHPTPELAQWIHKITLEIVQKSEYEWVGPEFRDHSEPFTGHLETAHLCWGISAVLDLSAAVFSKEEQELIKNTLQEKGIKLCKRWIAKNQHLGNWRSIMVSGTVVASIILGDEKTLSELLPDLELCQDALQPDGSFGESLQYGNYLLLALTFAKEAILRYNSGDNAGRVQNPACVQNDNVGNTIKWYATSMFYAKPLAGWGEEPYSRAANFNDSAAIFRPSGDYLLHIAARSEDKIEKGLAKWLFEKYYVPVPDQSPHDLAMLGMRNDWGFLTLPLLAYPSEAISPEAANLPLTNAFSNGNAFIRDSWEGKTILAMNGGGDPLHGLGHLHGDLNSFILVHNQERLLADPGHSSYRNLIHGLESSSQTHNTCTFLIEKEALGLQEDMAKALLLEQKSVFPRRIIANGKAGDKIIRGDKRLIFERKNNVSVFGAEVSAAYGQPITEFSRLWIMAESNVVFIIDRIKAEQPVTTIWNWLVNNKDRKTVWQKDKNALLVKKNKAGMKIFHGGEGNWQFPVYGFLHDAYHPEPNQQGEGRSGDAYLFRFIENQRFAERLVVHAIALDDADNIEQWHFEKNNGSFILKNEKETWTLNIKDNNKNVFSIKSNTFKKWEVQFS
jgi:hypothetical protein